MTNRRRLAWLLSSSAVSLVGGVSLAAPAFAQEASEPDRDVVIITAQKRETAVEDTPIAVSVLAGDTLAEQGITEVGEALSTAPAVQVQGLAQGAQVFIRGVGSSIDPGFADPAVALMQDGVYNGRTEGITGSAFDLERIEVLRGPQGTLYGRNATGGVVNVITASPKLGEYGGYVRGEIGNYSNIRGEAALNIPLGDIAAVRVSGFKNERDGYIDDGSWDANAYGARLGLLIEPSEALDVLVRAEVYDEDSKGVQTVAVPGSAGNLTFPPPIFFTNFDPPTAIPANALTCPGSPFIGCAPNPRFPNGWEQFDTSDPWSSSAEFPPGVRKVHSEIYSATVNADLGFGVLTLLPSYAKHDTRLESSFLFGNLTGPYQVQETENTYTSLEARLASEPSSQVKWILGAYTFKNEGGPVAPFASGAFTTAQTNDPTETLAVFGELTYTLSDTFRLTGGLRFSNDKSATEFRVTGPSFDSGVLGFSQDVNSSTFKVGFESDVGERALIYGHVASGFKQGGISPTVPAQAFEPEKLMAYEVGYKDPSTFGGFAELYASLFYYDYEDYQLSYFVGGPLLSTGEFANFVLVDNAGKTNILGAEVEAFLHLTDDDTVSLSATALSSEYGQLTLPNNPFVNQGNFELEGRQTANAPEFTASIGYDRIWAVLDGELTTSIVTRYNSGYFATPEQYLPGAEQDAFWRSDARATYRPNTGGWSLSLFAQNLENDAQTTYVFPAYRRFVSAPRTYGASFNIEF